MKYGYDIASPVLYVYYLVSMQRNGVLGGLLS